MVGQAGHHRGDRNQSLLMSHLLEWLPIPCPRQIHSLLGILTKRELIAYSAPQHVQRANERHPTHMRLCCFQISGLSSCRLRLNEQKAYSDLRGWPYWVSTSPVSPAPLLMTYGMIDGPVRI